MLLCSQEGAKGGSQGKGGSRTEGLCVWRHDSNRAHELAQTAKQGIELAVLVLEEAVDAPNGKGGKSEPYAVNINVELDCIEGQITAVLDKCVRLHTLHHLSQL